MFRENIIIWRQRLTRVSQLTGLTQGIGQKSNNKQQQRQSSASQTVANKKQGSGVSGECHTRNFVLVEDECSVSEELQM